MEQASAVGLVEQEEGPQHWQRMAPLVLLAQQLRVVVVLLAFNRVPQYPPDEQVAVHGLQRLRQGGLAA